MVFLELPFALLAPPVLFMSQPPAMIFVAFSVRPSPLSRLPLRRGLTQRGGGVPAEEARVRSECLGHHLLGRLYQVAAVDSLKHSSRPFDVLRRKKELYTLLGSSYRLFDHRGTNLLLRQKMPPNNSDNELTLPHINILYGSRKKVDKNFRKWGPVGGRC